MKLISKGSFQPTPGRLEPAKAERFTDLVQYLDGSVVSRTLLSNSAATLTLFAFDAGQSLKTHSAPFDALVQVLEGSATITIDSTPHQLTAGESILMPADAPHAVEASARFKMLLTMIRGKADSAPGCEH